MVSYLQGACRLRTRANVGANLAVSASWGALVLPILQAPFAYWYMACHVLPPLFSIRYTEGPDDVVAQTRFVI